MQATAVIAVREQAVHGGSQDQFWLDERGGVALNLCNVKITLRTIKSLFPLPVRIVGLGLILAGPANGQSGNYNGLEWQQVGYGIEIYGYSGSGGAVTIPGTILVNGANLPVTSIGYEAFVNSYNLTRVSIGTNVTSIGTAAFASTGLTSITIPDSVTSIGEQAFEYCYYATSVTIGNGVTSIGFETFDVCDSMTSLTIGNSVTNIGYGAFGSCDKLTNVTIPNCVTSIGDYAFSGCTSLKSVYFQGNAPTSDATVFNGDNGVTVYYLPWTSGWSTPIFGNVSTAVGSQQMQTGGAGVRTNLFGFTLVSTNNQIIVEACTNFANPYWQPVQTNTLTGGSSYFSDPQWTNYPGRFYRLCLP